MKKINFSAKNLLDNNKVLLLISLIIAFGIWVTVSPQREVAVNCPIKLSTNNSSAEKLGLEIISGKEQTISVTISGKWYNISDVTANDIDISYSFSGVVNSGDYDVAISATKANATDDFTIESVSPEKVTVSMDHIATAEYNIEVSANNIDPSEGCIIGTPIIDNDMGTIKITGPATKIKKLKRVVAEIDDKLTLTESKAFKSELKFYDKNDKEIDISSFTIPYSEVDVIIPLNQTKDVSVKAQFENVPEAYKSKSISYSLSEKSIELVGTIEALEKINSIELEPIDFKNLTTENNKFELELNLPSGVTASNGINKVTVTVDMNGFTSKRFEISKFKSVNSPANMVSNVETKYKSVTVVGPADVINNLEKSDLYIEYDMSKVTGSTGSAIVVGTVKSSKYKTIWGTGDLDVRVNIKNS